MSQEHRLVVVGGGFAGLSLVRSLKRSPVQITLVDRENYHVFQPLLYQVATGGLSPANIAAPLRSILRRQKNARVILGEVVDLDPEGRSLVLSDGELSYDTLVVATGARHHYFGHDEWADRAPGLKNIDDATEIRRRILLAFETAEREQDPERQQAWLTFCVVGGGPTGVELAGTLAEIARDTLRDDFRSVDPGRARVVLLEALDRVLPPYHPTLSKKAAASLERLGVEVRTGGLVTDLGEGCVTVRVGETEEEIPCRTVLWAAGVRASSLGDVLERTTGAERDGAGRILVTPHFSIPRLDNVFVIGDLARYEHAGEEPLPGLAPVAIQEGEFVGKLIDARVGNKPLPAFKYRDRGSMATIGRHAAVAQLGRLRLAGYLGWLAWLFVHLMALVGFQNRLLVFVQWAWNYVTLNRSARLITGGLAPPLPLARAQSALSEEKGTDRNG